MTTPVIETPQANTLDLTVPLVKDNPTWADMISAFDGMMAADVDAPIQQLDVLRFLEPGTDPVIIQRTVRMLGFDVSQDILGMNAGSLTRLVTQLPLYPDYNSTVLFENFIDLLLNALTSVEYLYTRDYTNFYSYPKGTMITEGGQWFKTTHVNLLVELLQADTAASSGSKTLFQRIVEVFYTFCPIALVLNNFIFVVNYKIEYGYAAYLIPPDLEQDIDH